MLNEDCVNIPATYQNVSVAVVHVCSKHRCASIRAVWWQVDDFLLCRRVKLPYEGFLNSDWTQNINIELQETGGFVLLLGSKQNQKKCYFYRLIARIMKCFPVLIFGLPWCNLLLIFLGLLMVRWRFYPLGMNWHHQGKTDKWKTNPLCRLSFWPWLSWPPHLWQPRKCVCGAYFSCSSREQLQSYRVEPMFLLTLCYWQPWWRHLMRSLVQSHFTWNILV